MNGRSRNVELCPGLPCVLKLFVRCVITHVRRDHPYPNIFEIVRDRYSTVKSSTFKQKNVFLVTHGHFVFS